MPYNFTGHPALAVPVGKAGGLPVSMQLVGRFFDDPLLLRTPMRRFGRVEELASAAVFLSSEAASFVTGTLLTVDGGFLASAVNQ